MYDLKKDHTTPFCDVSLFFCRMSLKTMSLLSLSCRRLIKSQVELRLSRVSIGHSTGERLQGTVSCVLFLSVFETNNCCVLMLFAYCFDECSCTKCYFAANSHFNHVSIEKSGKGRWRSQFYESFKSPSCIFVNGS